MLHEGPIPQTVQGLLEYLAGFLFIAAPFLFGYTDNGVATAASIVLGIAFLVLAAISQGPTGLVKQLGPPVHALLDALLAVLLIAAPFVLGFSGEPTPRNLFLITGVVWLLVTIGSRYGRREQPEREDAPRPGAVPSVSSRATQRGAPPAPAPVRPPDETLSIDPVPPTAGGPSAPAAPSTGRTETGGMVGPEFGPLDGGRRSS